MRLKNLFSSLAIILIVLSALASIGSAQGMGTIKGAVTLANSSKPVHNVRITIIQLKRSVETGEDGTYEFQNVPPGRYELTAHLDLAADVVKSVVVTVAATITTDFQIELAAVREQITVTATGAEETAFSSIQSVTIIGALELAKKNPASLGEALDNELGVAKRSFGPGTARPVIRGFDGDRVVVLQDGQRVGALGFQSGDHAEPVDVLSVDRVEVVKGPATLLYGSSAIGGVVNLISTHDEPHPGVRGYVTGLGSTNSYQAGGSAGIEYGTTNWLLWANGGGQRAGDYETPLGRVTNSYTRNGNASGGFGYYKGKGWFSTNYSYDNRRYGIPLDILEEEPELVYLTPHRHSVEAKFGMRDLQSFLSGTQFSFQYNDYKHAEINGETGEANTTFNNRTFTYQGLFEERRSGRFSGSFGFWGLHRDYKSVGEEALAPPTTQDAFAAFALQKIDIERVGLQFGGRIEHNGYTPDGLQDRSFTGFSGAAGIRVPLVHDTAVVANFTHSYRAPALEELYNNGPHPGNQTFEIGNPNLNRELSDGLDISLRHSSERLRAELNYFYYHIRDFVFLAPTGEVEDGLTVANYAQGTSRFTGAEARLEIGISRNLWFLSSLDYVSAKLTETGTPLPRIPPRRGRIGFEALFKGFRFYPEVIMSDGQNRVFPTETQTAGWATVNFTASYTIAKRHSAQIISFNAFNLNDKLYYNHLSFIKDFAPEIGRGFRLVYTIRFF
ncbi:MAG: TonB-dependent receptor [Acidobacteria bacterium]|nr:TonB-dependent receptor [Acidobacteriota bacterium]